MILPYSTEHSVGIDAEDCNCFDELEKLRDHLYSELAESTKEIDTLRTDLNESTKGADASVHWHSVHINTLT